MTRVRTLISTALAAAVLTLASASGAYAADGSIAHVEPTSEGLQIIVSVPPDVEVDLDQVSVTIDGQVASTVAVPAATASQIRRTTVLAVDTSNSMEGPRFEAAKAAALAFLDAVPDNVYVGIVSFAADVTPSLEPTLDRAAAATVVKELTLTKETRLYDGVLAAVEMAGDDGLRSLLVLSDGADTSETDLGDVTSSITGAGIAVDVVALQQEGKEALEALTALASAGDGQVIPATPKALKAALSKEAAVLARQVLVTAQVPGSLTQTEASVRVTLQSDAGPVTADAFATVQDSVPEAASTESEGDGWSGQDWTKYAGIGAFGLGLVLLLGLLVPQRTRPMSVVDRVAQYTSAANGPAQPRPEAEAALTQAKEAASQVLDRSKGLEARISTRLDGAGSDLKSSEWLLVHVAIFLGAGMVGLLLGRGSLVVGLLFLTLGVIGPWVYLGIRRTRRRKAFNSSLPETLQLMSGSLSAGLSLGQSVDTIVREGTEPVSTEFKRVLVETRLGVSLEDALDGVAERFESKDFAWVVMAIRIQRQVGGNLAELLDTVAATMREREYMRRQVAALSAEGKLSAYVLGGLPPLFLLYLVVAQRDYVMPLFTDGRGIVMLVFAAVLLTVGGFWMSKLVKVEV